VLRAEAEGWSVLRAEAEGWSVLRAEAEGWSVLIHAEPPGAQRVSYAYVLVLLSG
jgi:hypothetical protein